MTDQRKRYDSTFKAKVVLESFKNEKTIAELASDYGVHPNQIAQWRKQALEDLPTLFSSHQARKDKAHEEEEKGVLETDRPAQGGETDWDFRTVTYVGALLRLSIENQLCGLDFQMRGHQFFFSKKA